MGELKFDRDILTMADLIAMRLFDTDSAIYNTPDSLLPRVRRNGRIIRPIRFYREDVERLFSKPRGPKPEVRSLKIETRQETVKIARPSILFKKRRR